MHGKLLVTDGGSHPAEKWAVATAEQIFPIDEKLEGMRLIEAKRVQLAIMEVLLPHHENNMVKERNNLAARGDAQLDRKYTPDSAASSALSNICSVLTGSPWEDRTSDPRWRDTVMMQLASHFATAQNIERQWHCHRSGSDQAKAWLAKHHPEPEIVAEEETVEDPNSIEEEN